MNNIIFIIIDSLSYNRIHDLNQNISLTPFLDSIEDKCITARNMFSSGPYTEAGTKGLLCCCDTLDNGGYFNRYNSQEKFITDIFKDMGYETYNINAPSYLLSKKTLNNIDHMIYTSGFDCKFLWSQRFKFYYRKWKKGNFLEIDYKYLEGFVKLVFESADDFFNDSNKEEKYDMIKNIIDEDVINNNQLILKKEKEFFDKDSKKYIDSVFKLKFKHPLFKIQNIRITDMINTNVVNNVLKKRKKFIIKFKKIQFYRNLKNNRCFKGVFKRTTRQIITDKKITKRNCGEIMNRIRNVISGREIKVYKKGIYYTNDPYKLVPSSNKQFEYALSIINNNNKKDKFIFLHTEEPHYFNTFFSYDSNDECLIDKEFEMAEKFIDKLDSNYKGSLFYDLSVRYVDYQIKRLYNNLLTNGKLNDTLVVITADHGSSYFFNPIRKTLVNNFHSENYHIPLYIFGNGIVGKSYNQLCMGKDIIPTISQLVNKKLIGTFKGKSILDGKNDNNILIEYMGPGCPDIRLKPVWLSARSKSFIVCFVSELKNEFSEENIKEIYNIEDDYYELKNIKNVRNNEINSLIKIIKKRFLLLQKENS